MSNHSTSVSPSNSKLALIAWVRNKKPCRLYYNGRPLETCSHYIDRSEPGVVTVAFALRFEGLPVFRAHVRSEIPEGYEAWQGSLKAEQFWNGARYGLLKRFGIQEVPV